MGIFNWFKGAPDEDEGDEAILCECEECGTRYALGVNAVAVTMGQLGKALGGGRGRMFGAVPTGTPDLVGLNFGEESWPARKRLPPPKQAVPEEVTAAREAGEVRRWRCQKCNHEQPYPWCHESGPDQEEKPAVRRRPARPNQEADQADKIHFACPNCGRQVVVSAKFAGKRGRCPGCQKAVLIPAADGGEAE